MMKIMLLMVAGLVTVLCCTAPFFHAETLLHTEYSLWLDFFYHTIYFFTLSLVLLLIFPLRIYRQGAFHFILMAAAFELVQLWIPGRSFSVTDLAGNVLGVASAILLKMVVMKKQMR